MSVDHYENFPVASLLCPPALRPAVAAIYRFARTADDIADEGDAGREQRLADLGQMRHDLLAVFAGRDAGPRWPGVFAALNRAREQHDLPLQPMVALLDAFSHDASNPTYADRDGLLWYCQRSANPVGRLMLHLYGITDAHSIAQSDAICTALQLINFWQDLSVDIPRGRLYLPEQDVRRHGMRLEQVVRGRATLPEAPMQQVVRELCDWAVGLMREGAPLALRVPGRAGWELRLVVQGGLRVAQRIEAMGWRSWLHRPRLTAMDAPWLLWRAHRMRAGGAR